MHSFYSIIIPFWANNAHKMINNIKNLGGSEGGVTPIAWVFTVFIVCAGVFLK